MFYSNGFYVENDLMTGFISLFLLILFYLFTCRKLKHLSCLISMSGKVTYFACRPTNATLNEIIITKSLVIPDEGKGLLFGDLVAIASIRGKNLMFFSNSEPDRDIYLAD